MWVSNIGSCMGLTICKGFWWVGFSELPSIFEILTTPLKVSLQLPQQRQPLLIIRANDDSLGVYAHNNPKLLNILAITKNILLHSIENQGIN